MERRRFLQISAAVAVPNHQTSSPSENTATTGHFKSLFDYAIAGSFNSSWSTEDLEDEFSDSINFGCEIYMKASGSNEEDDWNSELLNKIQKIDQDDLDQNPEAYNWAMEMIDDFVGFLSYLDIFPEWIGDKLEKNRSRIRSITDLLPLLWSLKGFLDTGCLISNRLESGRRVAEETYIKFFKYAALAIVEVFLLVTGAGVAYRTAFKATWSINRMLVNRVGRRVGWKAYSWVLSQIHWGIRVVFAEGFGKAVDQATETTLENVSALIKERELSVSSSELRRIVEADVEDMAHHTSSSFNIEYRIWWIREEYF